MKISDKDFDKLISVAISQISDDDNVELKTDEELRSEGGSAHEFSPAFEKQMKKLIRENQKQQFTTYRKKFRSRIRIAILAAILVCAAMMFSVSAFRTSIINFIFNSGEKSSTFTFNDVSPSISDTFDKYLPTYIPQGFAIDSIREIPKENIYIQLTNGNGTYYEVQCELHSSHLSIDTENGQITELKINNAYVATVYKGNIIKNLIMDCQSYTKYRPNETTGGIFVSWRRKEELPTGA